MRETLPTLKQARRDTSTESKARDIRVVKNFSRTLIEPRHAENSNQQPPL
jgi:hypothetical protein